MKHAGLIIADLGKDAQSAQYDEVVVDTTLETLPIDTAKPWKVITIGPDFSDSFALNKAYIYHNLGYEPPFKAWVEVVGTVGGVARRRKYRMPYLAGNNFFYDAYADKEKVTIVSSFVTPDYPGSTFEANGFVYIFDKKFKFKT